jgi:hypothetical protein
MKSDSLLRLSIILINTLGLLGFLLWLVYSRERIFYTQEGVLYFLPCLPFFFVYFFMFRTAQAEEDLGD